MKYKIVFFGVKDTTKIMVDYLLNNKIQVDLVITIKNNQSKSISGYLDFKEYFLNKGVEVYEVDEYSLNSNRDIDFFRVNSFDIGISMGWQRLIPKNILDKFGFGVFGFHGSAGYLPFGRGRSPLNWSIINGDERFIINLFRYDEKADSPNVYKKVMWQINKHDDIRTLQYKNIIVAKKLLKLLISDYKTDSICISDKSNDFDSWYRKRSPRDGKINFQDRTEKIYNLVRGVSKPFPGAFAYIGSKKVTVWKAKPFDLILDFSDYKPGEIVEIIEGNLIIRTVDGSLIIYDYEADFDLEVEMRLV